MDEGAAGGGQQVARVTRDGGTVVAATIDGFAVSHHPVEADFLADAGRRA